MNDVVILTSTYNRANTLTKLYISLKSQNDNNFSWLIIDDGSTDNTKELVEDMINENKIDIKYVYQENGGKARALNKGFLQSSNAMVYVVVDSDDYLLPGAVEIIKKYLKEYCANERIGALFFHYNTPDGKVLKPKGELIKKDYIMSPYEYNRIFGKNDGCICYLKRVIEKYKYPEFEGEKYVGPTVIQMEMADEFKIVFSPKVIGVAEYQKGGLTQSGRRLRLKNPMGMIYYAKLMMSSKSSVFTQFKYAISIWPYAKIAKKSFIDVVRMVGRPILLLVTYIPGQILAIYWNGKTSGS
jgi:glycosyltransferase involved in cell wall biosynthesis